MQPLQLISNTDNERNTALASQRVLDDARAKAMETMLHGGSLDDSLKIINAAIESILGSCHCQIILRDSKKNLFRPLERTSGQYTHFVNGLTKHLFNKEDNGFVKSLLSHYDTIYPDIYDNQDWQAMHIVAQELGIVASWTIPILSKDKQLAGASTVLFKTSRDAGEDELALFHRAGQSVSALLHHSKNKAKELHQKVTFHQQYEAQKEVIEEVNTLLRKAVEQRGEVQAQLLELEKMAALGTMMSSLTHEINTPIGVSLTAAGFLTDMQTGCFEKLRNDQLKRSELINYLKESTEASQIIERNMKRADGLINTFKRLAVDQHSQDVRTFVLCDYVYEVLLSIKPRLKHTQHKFCIDIPSDMTIESNPGALSQILINLIMNSARHAFPSGDDGRITIQADIKPDEPGKRKLVLTYKDNGIGMSQQTIENIYKPFFTLARENDSCGLGMHICNNIVMKILRGTIDCQSEPDKGVLFTICFPV